MNPTTILTSIIVLMFSQALPASPREPGALRCDIASEHGKCRLAWDFSATLRMRYSIERLNPADGKWHVVQTRNAKHFGASGRVRGGHLYRVQACSASARAGSNDCLSSAAVWAAAYPPEHRIPEEVRSDDGQSMTVDKTAPYEAQLEQYNVYLLVRQLGSEAVDLATLPPMEAISENEIWADGEWTAREALQQAIYLNYSGMRDIAKQQANERVVHR